MQHMSPVIHFTRQGYFLAYVLNVTCSTDDSGKVSFDCGAVNDVVLSAADGWAEVLLPPNANDDEKEGKFPLLVHA